MAYTEEFAHLLVIYDGTPERWDHLPAQYLWFFVRGMVAGLTVSAVRARLAEIEQEYVHEAITTPKHVEAAAH
jgi:hypothetical protein